MSKEALDLATNDYELLPDSKISQRLDSSTMPSLVELFYRHLWATRVSHGRAWLIWVVVFNLVLIGFDWIIAPQLLGWSLLIRGAAVSMILLIVRESWRERRSDWMQGASVVLATSAIMGAAGVLGALGGEPIFEHYLTAGLFTVATATTCFPVRYHWTLLSIGFALALFLVFLAFGPTNNQLSSYLMAGFYGAAVFSLANTQRASINSMWKRFLSRVREERDRREVARLNAELLSAANQDPLTGISNRRAATNFLNKFWQDPTVVRQNIAFLMADIDHFKAINDTLGHASGDEYIRSIASIIKDSVRDCDLVSRHGGEEFLVVLVGTTAEEAMAVAERIRTRVQGAALPSMSPPTLGSVTLSLGLAMATEDASIEQVAKWADDALYRAKRSGRNRSLLQGTGGHPGKHPQAG